MQYIPDHYKNYSKYVREGIYNRKQQFDRQSQLYSVTENVELGQKLPAYVKFPRLSKELDEDLLKEHLWAQHARQVQWSVLHTIGRIFFKRPVASCDYQFKIQKW